MSFKTIKYSDILHWSNLTRNLDSIKVNLTSIPNSTVTEYVWFPSNLFDRCCMPTGPVPLWTRIIFVYVRVAPYIDRTLNKNDLGSKTTMNSGARSCLISFTWAPLTCSERGGGIQNENICLTRDSNPRLPTPWQESQRFRPLDHDG